MLADDQAVECMEEIIAKLSRCLEEFIESVHECEEDNFELDIIKLNAIRKVSYAARHAIATLRASSVKETQEMPF